MKEQSKIEDLIKSVLLGDQLILNHNRVLEMEWQELELKVLSVGEDKKVIELLLKTASMSQILRTQW